MLKKGMVLFPPQWVPVNPYSSMPMLAGQLERSGYKVVCKDSNIEFFDHILNRAYLEESCAILRKEKKLSDEKLELYSGCAENIENALETIKYGKEFYNIETYHRAMEIIQNSLEMVSERYAPQKITLYEFSDRRFNWDYSRLLRICSNEMKNMFYDFYMSQLDEFRESGADYICITVPCYTQLIPALTLGMLLKRNTDITVCIGGNIMTRIAAGIRANKDLLDSFCDYIILGDGERAIVRFADFLHGKCAEEDVPGMIWKDGFQVFSNVVDKKRNMKDIAQPSFTGLDLSRYYCPELSFAIEFARGCYWGKCSFCAVDVSEKKYCMKEMEMLVDEVELLVNKYGISNFVFVDEAIPVKKYLQFADMVIERGLNIHFYSFARLEKEYTYDVLSRLKEAGLSLLWWGYESKSERIMRLMNKGIDIGERIRILQDAHDAGIWNHCLCMAGFPTESTEEIEETFREIREHRELFNSCAMNAFFLSFNSPMYLEAEKYGITSISIPNAFDSHCHFKMKENSEEEYQRIVDEFRRDYYIENKNRLWPMEYNNFDHLLLYLKRYGCRQVCEYDSETHPILNEMI